MKIKLYNYGKLKEEEITDKVIRVKALMVNEKNEILLGEAFGTIQFPGGHLEEGEELSDGLKREVKEETGINLNRTYEPFFAIKYYLKDFPVLGNNRSIELYYYRIYTNEKPHLDKLYLDDQERTGDFKLFYVPIKNVKKLLKQTLKNQPANRIIAREMILALKYRKKR